MIGPPEESPLEARVRAEWFPWTAPEDVARVELSLGDQEALAGSPPGSFLYVDCGAWSGDGESESSRRDFALVCGRTVALCAFVDEGARVGPLPRAGGEAEGTAARERGALERAIAALAGPQRAEMVVRRVARAPEPESGAGRDFAPPDARAPVVHLLVPELHLPVLTTLPNLHPDLVPDPARATCPCHGPIVTRILYGSPAQPQAYRAVGTRISRNPNDWIFMMAESYAPAARDLVRLVDRAQKHGGIHLVQLGGLFDLWDGYSCAFQGAGRMAWVRPEVLRHVPEEDLTGYWTKVTHDTRVREAVLRVLRVPRAARTLLAADPIHGPPLQLEEDGAPPQPDKLELPGVMLAENRPEPIGFCTHTPPLAFFALLEQRAQFRPWRHRLSPGWRWAVLVSAARRWRASRFGVYAMAHTESARLFQVDVRDGERAPQVFAEAG